MIINLTKLITNLTNEILIDDIVELDKKYLENTDIKDISKISVKGNIKPSNGIFEVNLNVKCTLTLICSISLKDVKYDINININETIGDENDDIDLEENNKIINNTIDLIPIIWQNILLEVPLKVIGPNVDRSKLHGDGWKLITDEEELKEYRYYHKYWKKRGIVDEDIIELFDLGYDYKNDCITFPVRDVKGNCLFVAKRSVKTKRFNYPKGVDKPLYGLYALHYTGIHRFLNAVYITESMIDCILLWQAGKNAVALNGTGSALQFKQLNSLPCRHFILATDNDEAGERARAKIQKNVRNKLITEIQFPATIKDVGDLGKAGRFDDIKNIEQWEVFY